MRTLLHVSDVHFGPKHQPDRSAAILALAAERKPDFVVVSGDLTQRAKPRQFRAARAFVDGFGAPVLAVPGNHDVPLYRVWERLLAPFAAYRRHFSAELEPVVEDAEVLIVGVNTAHNWTLTGGRVRGAQLRRVETLCAGVDPGRCRIAVLHHHMVPPPDRRAKAVLRGSARALHDLDRVGVDLVLSGHLHRSFMARAGAQGSESGMLIVHTGTTTSSRGREAEAGENTCNWIEIDRETLTIESLHWTGTDSGGRFSEKGRQRLERRSGASA